MGTNKMRDLKALAEAAGSDEWYAAGDLRYCDDKTGETHGLHHDDGRFIAAASPAAILALLAEIERLKAENEDYKSGQDRYEQIIEDLKAENEALRSLVLSALEEGKGRPGSGGNAPGHCHDVPGVWDRGNGDRSGTPCGWCRIWNAAQAMAKEVSHG